MTAVTGVDLVTAMTGPPASALRERRPVVAEGLRGSHLALFAPEHGDYGVPVADRVLLALYLSGLHRDRGCEAYFGDLAGAVGAAGLVEVVRDLAEAHAVAGPYGSYALAEGMRREDRPGLTTRPADYRALPTRLRAAFAQAHRLLLHPRDMAAEHLEALLSEGWNVDQTVVVTQLVAVIAAHLRISAGIRAIVADPLTPIPTGRRTPVANVAFEAAIAGAHPTEFTDHPVAWSGWLPLPEDDRERIDWVGLFGARAAGSPSFRLAARDPQISFHMVHVQDDIFERGGDGLHSGEREFAALVVSRENGCLYCASVHGRQTTRFTGETDRVRQLLRGGTSTDVGERWNVLAEAAVALVSTPIEFGAGHVAALRSLGLDDLALLDFVHSVGYFSYANRIMLSLGQPHYR